MIISGWSLGSPDTVSVKHLTFTHAVAALAVAHMSSGAALFLLSFECSRPRQLLPDPAVAREFEHLQGMAEAAASDGSHAPISSTQLLSLSGACAASHVLRDICSVRISVQAWQAQQLLLDPAVACDFEWLQGGAVAAARDALHTSLLTCSLLKYPPMWQAWQLLPDQRGVAQI